MKNFLSKIITHEITTAVITLLAGLGLIIFPHEFVATVCYVLGALALFFAITGIFKYIVYHTSFFSLGFGIAMLVIGITLILRHKNLLSVLPFGVGIFLLINGVSEFTRIIDYRKKSGGKVLVLTIISAITVIAGLVLLLYPFESEILFLRIVGVCLTYSAIENLFRLCYIKNKLDKKTPIEGTFLDVSDKE